jgi:hypothetical protein
MLERAGVPKLLKLTENIYEGEPLSIKNLYNSVLRNHVQ